MSRQRKTAIRLGLFLATCFSAWLILLHLAGGKLVPGQHGYRVEAVVPDALSLTRHADVRQAGVRIGEVDDLRGTGTTTALMLDLDRAHAPVYRDARVYVRAKSIAGENYLELDPGTPQAGRVPDGGRLPIDRAQEATQLDDILSVLDRRRRRQLRRALEGLGSGLDRRGGDLNRLLEASSAAVDAGAPVGATLAQQRGEVATLVDALGRVTRALGDERDAIRVLVDRAGTAATAVAARDDHLRQAVSRLPRLLVQARGTAGRLRTFSLEATPVVANLRLAVQDLAPAVADLRTAAPAGRRVVRHLLPFARAAQPAIRQLGPFSNATRQTVPPLADTLRQANPLLAYLAPYWRELSTFFANVGAANEATDAIGHIARIVPLLSRSSLPGTLPAGEEQMFKRLTDRLKPLTGSLDTRGYNAYPAPGEAGLSKPFTGSYPRLVADPPYRPAR